MSRAAGRGTRAPETPALDAAAVDLAGAAARAHAERFGAFHPRKPETWPPVTLLTADQIFAIAKVIGRLPFNPDDPDTWPITMTPHHIAAIYQRTVGAVRKACQLQRFIPAPFKHRPYLWRRVDVLRDVEGARGGFMRKAG